MCVGNQDQLTIASLYIKIKKLANALAALWRRGTLTTDFKLRTCELDRVENWYVQLNLV
jgi:hypothetical protein